MTDREEARPSRGGGGEMELRIVEAAELAGVVKGISGQVSDSLEYLQDFFARRHRPAAARLRVADGLGALAETLGRAAAALTEAYALIARTEVGLAGPGPEKESRE
jgi:hypothetical protein